MQRCSTRSAGTAEADGEAAEYDGAETAEHWKGRARLGRCWDDDVAAAAATCIVCLERLRAADEVRRLGNCAHAFHRGCIDGWIDLGRTTCPLCRSHLLPRARRDGPLASLLTRVW